VNTRFYFDGVKDKYVEFKEVFSRDAKKTGMIMVSLCTEITPVSGPKVITTKVLSSAAMTHLPFANDFIYKIVDGIEEFEDSRDYQVFITHLKMLMVHYRKFFAKDPAL
jgi:hypothetical protein